MQPRSAKASPYTETKGENIHNSSGKKSWNSKNIKESKNISTISNNRGEWEHIKYFKLNNETRTFKYERFSGGEPKNRSVSAWSNSIEHDAKAPIFLVAVFSE